MFTAFEVLLPSTHHIQREVLDLAATIVTVTVERRDDKLNSRRRRLLAQKGTVPNRLVKFATDVVANQEALSIYVDQFCNNSERILHAVAQGENEEFTFE